MESEYLGSGTGDAFDFLRVETENNIGKVYVENAVDREVTKSLNKMTHGDCCELPYAVCLERFLLLLKIFTAQQFGMEANLQQRFMELGKICYLIKLGLI